MAHLAVSRGVMSSPLTVEHLDILRNTHDIVYDLPTGAFLQTELFEEFESLLQGLGLRKPHRPDIVVVVLDSREVMGEDPAPVSVGCLENVVTYPEEIEEHGNAQSGSPGANDTNLQLPLRLPWVDGVLPRDGSEIALAIVVPIYGDVWREGFFKFIHSFFQDVAAGKRAEREPESKVAGARSSGRHGGQESSRRLSLELIVLCVSSVCSRRRLFKLEMEGELLRRGKGGMSEAFGKGVFVGVRLD